jgi:uncharacterized protein (TIGR03086 family)
VVVLDLLSRAGDGFALRLARVLPDQWTAPTPCAEWDVRALVNHVVGANRRYTMLLHGATAGAVDATRIVDHLGLDPLASFVTTAAELNAAFREPGALARTAHHPAGERTGAQLLEMRVLDVAVHTWDLARAIGHSPHLDPEVAERGLAFMSAALTPENRGESFGPEVPVPADAPVYDRLAAFAGRTP